ncbi:hypothetical protein [Acuticoccus sp. I52.16.1]|uniref:hypothetical protein n=1 Tax=Acuticoccus sp. I52.16.1 TaxID=2928472 RepID=UPI001FD50761|nr:hypothetical protein [Acuticoccus sp. I52.16.1]UOM37313.1 hypothetical protein MRB58_24720 [Acuticoccus sp. I52.16.1]
MEEASGAPSPAAPPRLYVCTHHRCGTVLLRNIFTRYTKFADARFFKGNPKDAPAEAGIVQDAHSRSPIAKAGAGLHIFRDPFDLLLSHIRYHETTRSPTEPPNAFILDDGRTYGEHLREQPTLSDKALFEIDHVFGRTLKSMVAWDYANPAFKNYPLDIFLDADNAAPVAAELAHAFPVLDRETLTGAIRHFIVNAPHIRAKHGTRTEGERAVELFSPAVVERVHAEFPGVADVQQRLAAALTPRS